MNARMVNRRDVLVAVAGAAAGSAFARGARTPIEIWKDPDCGCCKDWVAHLEAHGFVAKVYAGGNDDARARLGVAPRYASCHTGLVGGYAIEGHVPAREIRRLLADKPPVIGLSVPGMPVGAPGMDGPAYGGRKAAFDVLMLSKDGSAQVYQHYEGNKA